MMASDAVSLFSFFGFGCTTAAAVIDDKSGVRGDGGDVEVATVCNGAGGDMGPLETRKDTDGDVERCRFCRVRHGDVDRC